VTESGDVAVAPFSFKLRPQVVSRLVVAHADARAGALKDATASFRPFLGHHRGPAFFRPFFGHHRDLVKQKTIFFQPFLGPTEALKDASASFRPYLGHDQGPRKMRPHLSVPFWGTTGALRNKSDTFQTLFVAPPGP